MQVFISYRRDDAASDARLLYEKLVAHFGSENVFLDVVDIQPGMEWLTEIRSRGSASGVFVAVIGPAWLSQLVSRLKAGLIEATDDIVKQEIEFALSRGSELTVVPVLVAGATMPRPEQLPKSLRRLTAMQAVQLRHTNFDEDVDHLIERLERLEGGAKAPQAGDEPSRGERPSKRRSKPATPSAAAAASAPDERHFQAVIRHMVDDGSVVPVLGSRVCGTLPDADEIAAKIAEELGLELDSRDLARVAQHVYVSSGASDLNRRLKRILNVEPDPGPVHRFLAGYPAVAEKLGDAQRYQMILSTNYDSSLERAFDEANEPYDLAVYMASGSDQGKFVHFPYDRYPEPVLVPNSYTGFPIDDSGELERTVIVKVHGAVDSSSEGYGWKDNYVVTEDQYIDYLSRSPIESLVPFQILTKLRESHCLFLGYRLQDWNLRVFLKRIWHGEQLGSRSWAIEEEPDFFELDFWRQANVDLFAASPDDYVRELDRRILALQDET